MPLCPYFSPVPRVDLTRTVRFSAAHRYYRPDWPEERNRREFGPCSNEHGHGHNYTARVTVSGEISAATSMVMNLAAFDTILAEEITEPLDHRHLNHDVPEFAFGKTVPTAEALAVYIWERIVKRLPEGTGLVSVRVEEDDTLAAEYHGP